MQFYVMIDGNRHGPYSPDEVRQYLSTGQLQPQMQAWCEGMTDWQPLENFAEFSAAGAETGRSGAPSRARLYVSLAAGAVALCAVAGWLVWRGKLSNGAATAKAQGAATAPTAPAAPMAPAAPAAGDPGWPKTLAELNQWYAEPPAGQNAAELFLQGCDAMDEQIRTRACDKNTNLPFIGKAAVPSPGSPMPAAMKTAIAAFIQQSKPAWDLFGRGSALAQSRYPVDLTKAENMQLPHLARIKQAAQVLAVFALGYADTQRGKEAGDSLLIGYALGRSLETEPVLISQMVRVACNAIATSSLEQTVNRIAIPPQSLLQLQEVLGRLVDREASGESFSRAFVGQKLLVMSNFGDQFESPEKLQELRKQLDAASPEQLQSIQKDFDSKFGTNSGSVKDVGNVKDRIISNLQKYSQLTADGYDRLLAAHQEPFPSRLKAVDTPGQNDGRAILIEAGALAYLRLAQTAVALERFRAANGSRYPNDLPELSPKFLASVPEDPFDGLPLRYTKSGNGYTLHSIGPPGASDAKLKDLSFTVSNPPKPAAAAP